MVVGVIIAKTARQTDKIFDYEAGSELCEKICIGKRVTVPFGPSGDLTEAYVFEIKGSSSAKKLKKIASVDETEAFFDVKGAELIEWICKTTLCRHIDAVRLLVPSGTESKFEKRICLTDGTDIAGLSGIFKEIAEELKKEGGSVETVGFMSRWEKNISRDIKAMSEAGVIQIKQINISGIKTRTVRCARLAIDEADVSETVYTLSKRAPRQAKIVEILRAYESVSLSELIYLSSASYGALDALKKKGVIEIFDKEEMRDPNEGKEIEKEEFGILSYEQKNVYNIISDAMDTGEQKTFLLHGVTGSGKTEVYMHLIAKALGEGKDAIVLVPEISLTPLMTKRFVSRFGKNVAILHSGLSMGERFDEWKRIKRGEAKVVVGARSAVFAPLEHIGIIIIDEEHEYTYKSEMSPKYHARDVAIKRCEQYGAVTVLASATPLVESYYRAKTGKYTLLQMRERYNGAAMPEVYIADMRRELQDGNRSMFSEAMSSEIQKNMRSKKQTILFLNRRGFSTFVSCRKCGYVAKCPHCNISLTYHRHSDRLVCHYCGYTHENYDTCPECGSKYIRYFGAGTQKLEDELTKKFEGISILRMDFDTTSKKSSHEKILDKFEKEKTDVLIGTQMVSKGLDFHSVTLVGVMAADLSLYIDDYRSSERTFDLIEQVCGRAGRGKDAGRAIIQTYTPDHFAIEYAKKHDYKGFYEEEIEIRKKLWYPPFCDIVTFLISSANEAMGMRCAKEIAQKTDRYIKDNGEQKIILFGPCASAVSKIKDKYRFRIVLKCEDAEELNGLLEQILSEVSKDKKNKYVSVSVDKNPNSLI